MTPPIDSLLSDSDAADLQRRNGGVTTAIVTDNDDKQGQGRVLVKFPWSGKNSAWAPVMTPMAGDGRGLYCLPEVNDHVLVMFDRGRIDSPYVIGAIWSGKDKPPFPGGNKKKNDLRIFRSRSGHTITLDDTSGSEQVTVVDKSGKNTIVIDSKSNKITIHSSKDLSIEADGSLNLQAQQGITIQSQQAVTIKGQSVKVNDGALEVT
jgi:uncharacterized protein involved in type VI secretion and phage assembly